MEFKLKPYPHQLHAIDMANQHRDVGLLWEMGCLTGDTIINCNRAGKGFRIRLDDMYKKTHDGTWDMSIPTKVRSFLGERIGLHNSRNVVFSGVKQVFKLTLENGKTIRATANHEFLTDKGWVRLDKLELGSQIMIDTLLPSSNRQSKKKARYNCRSVRGHPYASKITYKRSDRVNKIKTDYPIEVHRLTAEASLNGLELEQFIKEVKEGKDLKFIDPNIYHVHHKDHNTKNNDPDNLEVLTKQEHLKLHGNYGHFSQGVIAFSKVKSINKLGEEKTFDIICEDPHRNFVANGLVVHNSGKTGGVINILRDRYAHRGRIMRTLILSPLVTLQNWKDEFGIHSYVPDNKIHILSGPSAKKVNTFMKWTCNKETGAISGDYIFITNYEALQSKKLLDFILAWSPEIIVADEAHYLKNPKAQRSKAAVKLGDKTHHNYILTGTPILNSVKDIYGMFRFLDRGDTFGKNFHVFVNTYMEDENAGWSNKPNHFPKLIPRTEKYDDLNAKIYHKCHRVLKKDVIKDLPPLIKIVHRVEMSKNQKKYYKEMERDFVTFVEEKEKKKELSGAVVAQLAITKALRLQQIVTGHVTTEDGETIYIEDNPRVEETCRLLQEIVVEGKQKCILWCSFRANYKQLGKLCEELKLNHVFLTGEQTFEQKKKSMDSFNNDPDVPIIIANRRAGGIGVNLVAASYSIVFSRNFSLADELQSEARNHRGGSQIHDSITKIDLTAPDTVDERVLDALRKKEDLSKNIIDVIRRK